MVWAAEDQSVEVLGEGYVLGLREARRSQGCDARPGRPSDMPPDDVRRTTTALPRLKWC